ncbi:ferric reductase-like transmembrane domain-containing protein [Nisaea nitritireducens]|uniref:ferric reductase-like transmembrane domain-containing protein n=1 Tax=Nisaea nitritireducens TaxID=568392 RepID=UPI0018694E1D|nr:ferric reductase-like transmembrane domain-containing protein [Nisaea nitritireducens]
MRRGRTILVWSGLLAVIATPLAAAAASPLLAWRDPIYIAAGFAGIVAMILLLVQPLLIGGYLPGLPGQRGRRVHRVIGLALVTAVAIHVAGLWITSPPDVIDALLFASPTPFSDWGVIAMWAVIAAAVLAVFRRRLRLRLRTWRLGHTALVAVTVLCSVVHAILIEGTMETLSKLVLCTLVVLAAVKVVTDLRVWAIRR